MGKARGDTRQTPRAHTSRLPLRMAPQALEAKPPAWKEPPPKLAKLQRFVHQRGSHRLFHVRLLSFEYLKNRHRALSLWSASRKKFSKDEAPAAVWPGPRHAPPGTQNRGQRRSAFEAGDADAGTSATERLLCGGVTHKEAASSRWRRAAPSSTQGPALSFPGAQVKASRTAARW